MSVVFSFEHVRRVSARRARSVVVDLSIGAGRGFQAASDLAAQLGIELPAPPSPARHLFDGSTYGDAADRGVDDEAAGDRVVLEAFAVAERLAPHVDAPVDVFPPRFGIAWERGDLAFLSFLAAMLPADAVALVAVEESSAPPPEDCTAALVPGLVEAAMGLETADLEPLREGKFFVPPRFRRSPDSVPATEYDWLAIRVAHVGWLAAWAQLRSNRALVRPPLLVSEAERLYASGHTALALAFMRRLVDCSEGIEQAIWLARLQGMRIGQLQFADAAAEPLPAFDVPGSIAGFLRQARGWGLVMTGQPEEADRELEEARALLGDDGSREHLYLLNISALGRARLGDIAAAEALERRIETRLATLEPRSAALEYINAINLHRLLRAGGRIPEARSYLERALATTCGTRSHNDAVYGAYNLWRVTEAEGRVEAALIEALHCTLLFLADEVPEALASRTVAGLLGEPWPMRRTATLDEICDRLRERFEAAVRAAGMPVEQVRDARVIHSAAADRELLRQASAVGTDGIGVLTARAHPAVRRRHGKAHDALRRSVTTALARLLPTENVIVVDDRHGRGLPRTASELAEVALAAEAARLRWSDAETVLDSTLDDARRGALLATARVTLGPGVERIAGRSVQFRRMLPPLELGEDARALLETVAAAEEPRTAASLCVPVHVLQTLERQRVLALTMSEIGR